MTDPAPSARPRLWSGGRSKFVFALGVVALLAVSHLVSVPVYSAIGRRLLDSLHAPVFGLLSIGVLLALRPTAGVVQGYAWTALIMTVLGVAGEAAQYLGPRNADLLDLRNDVIGIAAFLSTYAVFDTRLRERLRPWSRRMLKLAAAALMIAAIFPSAWLLYALGARATSLPQIVSFDRKWETEFYHRSDNAGLRLTEPPQGWPGSARNRIAEVEFSGGDYPGIAIHGYPDWRGYSHLSMLVSSPGDRPAEFVLRINDATHDSEFADRFNLAFEADETARRLDVPLQDVFDAPAGRQMDPRRIVTMIIFGIDDARGRRLLLDDVRLERRAD